jgi:transposase-like protein
VIYFYLDGFAPRVRSGGKVVSAPVLGVVGVLTDGRKYLLALELCGGESCRMERLSRRPRRARAAGAGTGDHRRQSWLAPRCQ